MKKPANSTDINDEKKSADINGVTFLEDEEMQDSCNVQSMDLLAELMNQNNTENLVYMKSINNAA